MKRILLSLFTFVLFSSTATPLVAYAGGAELSDDSNASIYSYSAQAVPPEASTTDASNCATATSTDLFGWLENIF